MQIYSAMIPVKETFSKKEFVRLLLEWNQGSALAGGTKTAGSGRPSGKADNRGKISENRQLWNDLDV